MVVIERGGARRIPILLEDIGHNVLILRVSQAARGVEGHARGHDRKYVAQPPMGHFRAGKQPALSGLAVTHGAMLAVKLSAGGGLRRVV